VLGWVVAWWKGGGEGEGRVQWCSEKLKLKDGGGWWTRKIEVEVKCHCEFGVVFSNQVTCSQPMDLGAGSGKHCTVVTSLDVQAGSTQGCQGTNFSAFN
jgi:hypothetical protein